MTDFCCNTARKSLFLRHGKTCRVWKAQSARDLKKPADEDIGQGEGCEGGKCAVPR
jgi:hypothetical protein